MPKLPILKAKSLIKALRKLGFVECRQRGTSHLIMKHFDGRRTSIPVHSSKDIPRGTLGSILRDVDISRDEFLKALRQ
ncbi:MAG: hypothetical protein COX44_02580 [Candidatus Portnoybacteria bacterium CG23_combo_of_CG06-09_8_20_14_all_37_13]|uniref:Addiction module toxin, HicA family n=1 Tax=Candidatus Portnoybacteria bacterium CG23_combo_of_CG06-09_8_20_14_all_37_13 TaxID=1974819 RepID=A0A2G9YCJ6_9BACT|nr:MAG: hypothetical protein COX44_02580 [Candidatus Portnoybacteria bacterium CG23_combo_of_CG06-09_8_20_14_all_37_13]